MNEAVVDVNSVDVVKGGETCISLGLERSTKGLRVTIKAHPRVEEFFKTLCGNEVKDAQLTDRHWRLSDDNAPLYCYTLPPNTDGFPQEEGGEYVINRVGAPLVVNNTPDPGGAPARIDGNGRYLGYNPKVNISFLRMVGISESQGITFYVGGVYSKDAVIKLLEQIGTGLRRFYIDFIRPMNVSVQISTQSI